MKAAFHNEGLGGRALWVGLVIAENAIVLNEWGKLDMFGHKDTNKKPSFVHAITGGLFGKEDTRSAAEAKRDDAREKP